MSLRNSFFALAMVLTNQIIAMEQMEPPEILMFVGNPGVGKSSIINALKKERVAHEGVNLGSGLTPIFSKYEHSQGTKNYFLFDTPGLDDVEMRQKAAGEIEKALKQEGIYRLFFVITLEAGRIKPADLTTIEMVMGAIKRDNVTFNVIVNKVTKQEKAKIEQAGVDNFLKLLNSGRYKTESVFYIDIDRELEDGDKQFFITNPELEDFFYRDSKAIFIKKLEVEKIKIDQFEELNKAHAVELEKLKTEIKELQNRPQPAPVIVYVQPSNNGNGGLCVVQ